MVVTLETVQEDAANDAKANNNNNNNESSAAIPMANAKKGSSDGECQWRLLVVEEGPTCRDFDSSKLGFISLGNRDGRCT